MRSLEERKSNVIHEESCVAFEGDNLVAIEGYREDSYKYCEDDSLNHSSMSLKHQSTSLRVSVGYNFLEDALTLGKNAWFKQSWSLLRVGVGEFPKRG